MSEYYRDAVPSGIYIAVRGITDTWDLHFRPDSYPLYDRLIRAMIRLYHADPNRVYLPGFSAGGDGVYQIAPRMADRFAAAGMSSGLNGDFSILVNPRMLDVSRPIQIVTPAEEFTVRVNPSPGTLRNALRETGDPSLAWVAEIPFSRLVP